MAGTWTTQNKALPGIYMNFQTNAPLSITPGDRGTVVLLQEMTSGKVGEIYEITALDASQWPKEATEEDKFLAREALKKAKAVKVYNLGTGHTAETLSIALKTLKTVDFDVLCYPYPAETYAANQEAIKIWVTSMVDDEGRYMQAVLADFAANSENIINCAHAVKLSDGTELTNAQTTAWVAGVTAGAKVNQSNTGAQYDGAIDVIPRMTKTQMEESVSVGKWIFKVDSEQNVTAVYDINSLTTYTQAKSKSYRKNRFIRLVSGINNDITTIFESQYEGKFNNNAEGRSAFKTILVGYFLELQNKQAIQNFSANDVTVEVGEDSDAVVVTVAVQSVDSIEKVYMTVNLS
ncbi:phage tail sheath protein [Caproiciproducens galactitolivorans]|uniref:Phage tail sheath protein n=1 Tax=Caproiciproducens galactitolivorans TaxID=642589 RepID=A0A4Z0XVV2_9FIRM|nr:phage tail sheath C-terminal domain-containing protein [Caproiciproducens galactitolivorans]QEY33733.1 phage tail sheath protein [Caproiciproducens galactitolivorans]TGJ75484.1 phage tail sheath protein [Caproiciproducens galactitolivorans]